MFTNLCVFPVVEATDIVLVLSADANPVNVRVDLLGAKAGELTATAPVELQTVSIGQFGVARVRINTADHTAFDGGYGAIQLASVSDSGLGSPFVFTAWCSPAAPRDSNPASGTSMHGNEFRVPHLSVPSDKTQTVKIAVTNIGTTATVQVVDETKTWVDTATVETGQTYLWDSAALGRNMNNDGQVVLMGNGTFTCAAHVDRGKKYFLRPLPIKPA